MHRHYASVELTLASTIAMISGARPKENCQGAAMAIGGCAILGLLYVIVIRPFRTKLDMIFSTINNVVLVALSVSVIAALQQAEEGEAPPQWAATTIEASIWAISAISVTQVLVQGYWAYHTSQQRKLQKQQQEEGTLMSQLKTVPLLRKKKRKGTEPGSDDDSSTPPSSSDDDDEDCEDYEDGSDSSSMCDNDDEESPSASNPLTRT